MSDESETTEEPTEVDINMSRYHAACHAMQSGVRLEMTWEQEGLNSSPGPAEQEEAAKQLHENLGPHSHKHLRVGINSALCDSSALAKLLIAKGVITDEEYTKAIADEMEEEVARYRVRLGLPDNVKLA